MRVDAATTSYKYDSLNRLTQVTYSDGSVIKYTYDAAGNRLAQTITAPIQTETISTPSAPTGPISGTPGTYYAYSTGGAVSNLGHTVQYLFDWGDGTKTGWIQPGTTSFSKSWSANGTYTVTAQARCFTHTTVVSALSSGLSVNINSTETLSKPNTPTGPISGTPGTSYAYSTGGAVSNLGHSVQYLFDWGDGTKSAWLPIGTTSASKSWSANGTHTVTAQARCATDTAAVSAPSSGLAVNIGTYTITVSAAPTAGGTASPSTAKYASGATATVTATAKTGYFFTDWTEGGLSVYPSFPYSFTVTQSRTLVANFSTSSASLPNLTPFKPTTPTAWSDKLVVSTVSGTNTDALSRSPTDTLYVDWAVINNGKAAVTSAFYTELYVDGVLNHTWISSFSTSSPFNVNSYIPVQDYILGSLSAGTHTLKLVTDSTNVIAESNESDNQYIKTIVVGPSLTPYKPSGWSDKIVVSTVTGTHTDALYLSRTDTLYVDWAVINNGSAISSTFYTQLWVDGVLKTTWYTPPPVSFNTVAYIPDYNLGFLSVGTHTIKIVTDSTNVIAESNESDNQYIKTIVVGPNRTDFNSDGKSDYLLLDATGNTKVSYLNGATLLSTVAGPPVTTGWQLASVNDFNGDGKPDVVLFNPSTLQTQIWYLNGVTYVSNAGGPTLPSGWVLRATADFNQDGNPDYLLVDSTGNTRVYYLSGTALSSTIDGPSLPSGWIIVSANDFNGDGKPDYLIYNPSTLETKIWTISSLNGASSTYTSAVGPVIPSGWQLRSALGNYNYSVDKKPDWLLWNPITLQTQIWYMNAVTKIGSANGPTLPAGFSVFGR